MSDAFCRLATGGGLATRRLYSDSEEQIFEAMRPVILNGIDHLPERADLADRAVVLTLPSISETDRKDEDDLYAEFEAALPQILGALFDAVSIALKRRPSIRLANKPRMADFAAWATAAEPGLGLPEGAFMNAYLGNRAEAVQETVEGDSVGAAILTLMDALGEQTWEGTCKELLPELQRFVDDPAKASKEWPKTPRALSGRLRRLVTVLRETGILVEFGPRGGKGRRSLTLTRKHLHSTVTSVTTATGEPTTTVDQLVSGLKGDGRFDEVTVDERSIEQPSPPNSAVKSLKSEEHGPTVTDVTEATVTSGDIPDVGHSASERKNLCLKCGVVDWEWSGTAWACPHCGEAARA